jgi:hypothetical protein
VFEIAASIEGGFDDLGVVCSFDPTKVVARLQQEFTDLEVDSTDYAWRDYKAFLRMGLAEEREAGQPTALGVAAADARRRGPLWLFRVPTPAGGWVRGGAERHVIRCQSEEPFTEPLRSKLLGFANGLRFAPCVIVRCVGLEDNDAGTPPNRKACRLWRGSIFMAPDEEIVQACDAWRAHGMDTALLILRLRKLASNPNTPALVRQETADWCGQLQAALDWWTESSDFRALGRVEGMVIVMRAQASE